MLNIVSVFNSLENFVSYFSIIDFMGIGKFFHELVITLSIGLLGFVEPILNLIFDIASINFFSDTVISDFAKRVYIILGVLMLFKITISCIQYLINPDRADDKESGFGGILKRTIISVMLLALVPWIFQIAKEAQNAILESLPRIILDRQEDIDNQEIAKDIVYTTALAFFSYTSEECNDGSIGGLAGANSDPTFVTVDDISSKAETIVTAECKESGGGSRYTFNWFLCFLTGGFMIFTLISMVLDVGIRAIKFGFLELIAPIPIASYIDPKSSKKSFDSWVHNSITVYTDLFIRLGVIYFILYLFEAFFSSISLTYEVNGTDIGVARSSLVNVAIIIALFMFAKNAPKFICDVLGIKVDGDGSIANMFKRAAGFAGAGLGGLRAARSNYATQRERLKAQGKKGFASRAGALKSALAGAGSAAGRGLKMATIENKGFKDVRQASSKAAIAARDARNDRVDNLYTKDVDKWIVDPTTGKRVRNQEYYDYWSYRRDRRNANLGIPSSPGYTKAVYDVMDNLAQSAGGEKSFGATKMNERPDLIRVNVDGVDYSIATARSYANIQVGTTNVTKPDGTVGTWTVDDQARAMAVKESVEKKTSYIMTAQLINENDPTAKMNHEKTILTMKNNETMIKSTPGVMEEITRIFRDKGVIGPSDNMSFERMVDMMEHMPADANDGAKIIDAVKTSFENIRTNQYAAAQAAEARAKKTQEAIQNDNKKNS